MNFVELQLNEEGKTIGVNMAQVQTIEASTRTKGFTMLSFDVDNRKDYIEVFEPYPSVMSKVNK